MPTQDFAGWVMASSRSRLRQVLAGMTGVLVVQAGQGPAGDGAACPGGGELRLLARRPQRARPRPGAALHGIAGEAWSGWEKVMTAGRP